MSYKILVVDDTTFMRKMATDCLTQHGHTVVGEAVNGRDGIEKYRELQPDIVMMDLNMPEMSGIEAIKEILRINPEAVLLVCTTSNQQEHIADALAAGAKGYLTKPFNSDRLNDVIRKYAEPHLHGNNNAEDMQTTEQTDEAETYEEEVRPLKSNKGNRTNFVTSYMCNWNEEINGEMTHFSAICSEKEDKILIEMNDNNHEKQVIQFTFDGFRQLHDWLENHLGKTTT
jgi:two-component system chemotaxis response regulator CheY